MKILITGSNGFIGSNLIARLESQKEDTHIIYKYDITTPYEKLEEYTKDCQFVYHFAAVHRPKKIKEFNEVNYEFFQNILTLLEKNNNNCPVLYTSSIQVDQDSTYGQSKKMAEKALKEHAHRVKGKAVIYRLTNTFGKWAKPGSHSVVATFCYNVARNLDIYITEPDKMMNFYYIDDVIDSFIKHLYETVTPDKDGIYRLNDSLKYSISLGKLADLINSFYKMRTNHRIPNVSDDFTKKLYSTYLSYLPVDQFKYSLTTYSDIRGSFTEVFKTMESGQISINISKPGVAKGEHYHNTKCEKFLVVSGKALVQFRKIGSEQIYAYTVSGEQLEVIDIPVGYTHNLINIGDSDLVTIIWANEIFNPEKMDTYHEYVEVNKE